MPAVAEAFRTNASMILNVDAIVVWVIQFSSDLMPKSHLEDQRAS